MAKLTNVINTWKKVNIPLDRLCKIKKYIPIKEKIKFINEYIDELEKHFDDFMRCNSMIALVFFNLMVVKAYTDIDIECTYEEFDILQENGLLNQIVEYIGDDYTLLLNLAKEEIREEM